VWNVGKVSCNTNTIRASVSLCLESGCKQFKEWTAFLKVTVSNVLAGMGKYGTAILFMRLSAFSYINNNDTQTITCSSQQNILIYMVKFIVHLTRATSSHKATSDEGSCVWNYLHVVIMSTIVDFIGALDKI
jgi:hypothetical protein